MLVGHDPASKFCAIIKNTEGNGACQILDFLTHSYAKLELLGCWEVRKTFENRVGEQSRGGRQFGVNFCMVFGVFLNGFWMDLRMSNQESRIEANKPEILAGESVRVHPGSCKFTQVHAGKSGSCPLKNKVP